MKRFLRKEENEQKNTEQKKKRQYLPSGAAYKRCEQPGDFQKRYTCQPVFEKLYEYSIVCECSVWRYQGCIQQINSIYSNAPEAIKEIYKKILWTLLIKMNVPVDEAREMMGEIGGRGMGYLFEKRANVTEN